MTRLGSQKKPTVKWDEFRRQVLCCLYRFFHEDGSAFERIFSEFFKEHLRNRGFSNEFIAYRALYAQWRWMKRTEHNDWKFVHLETEFRTDREWKHVILIIKAIASRLGIVLREKFTEEDNTNDEMTATDPEDSEILLSSEEAMGVMIEELTSISVRNTNPTNALALYLTCLCLLAYHRPLVSQYHVDTTTAAVRAAISTHIRDSHSKQCPPPDQVAFLASI